VVETRHRQGRKKLSLNPPLWPIGQRGAGLLTLPEPHDFLGGPSCLSGQKVANASGPPLASPLLLSSKRARLVR